MLFTAGYLWTAYQFGIKKGSAPIKDWADLKGKVVAVSKGTPYDFLMLWPLVRFLSRLENRAIAGRG